jgi:hypothetical protein
VIGLKRSITILCVAAVLGHLAVSVLHGYAHSELAVALNSWQKVYVLVVITLAPLIALILLWLQRTRPGLLLLALSMAGALIFGVYFHYIEISPDHVSHLPPGDAQGLFRATALLLGITEAFGIIIALVGLRNSGRR